MRGTICFEAPNGLYVAGSDGIGAAIIASWLGNDIQYGKPAVDRELRQLASIESGAEPDGYLGAGNVTEISANRELVYVQEIMIPELKVLMTHAQARDALLKYRAFLDGGWRRALRSLSRSRWSISPKAKRPNGWRAKLVSTSLKLNSV